MFTGIFKKYDTMSIMIKHQHINTQCSKTFYVRNSCVFVTVKPFQPGQIFVDRARSLP